MFHFSCKTLWLVVALVVAIATPAAAQITISFESTVTSSTEAVARFGDSAAVPPISQVPIVITVDTDGSGNVDPGGTAITSLNSTISDGWSVTGSSALGADQLISFSALKKDSGLVYQRIFEGIGTNGKNSGRMDSVDEFLDFNLDLSSVPSGLQFQLVQIGFANTNSVTVNDPDFQEEEGTSYDPDLVITDFGGMTTVFENIRNGGGMGPVFAGVFDIEAGDVVLGGGSTGLFSFSQAELPRDFPFNGEQTDGRAVGYSLASITFDFVEAPTGLAGDFDEDGDVDGNDFLVWQRDPNVGSLADWQADYGMSTPLSGASVTAVPEPTCVALLSCLLLLLLATSRRVAV